MPGLNWAVGLDALRVLEWADEERLDWLLSVEADELYDIMERIKCGVHGSRFQAWCRQSVHSPSTFTFTIALPGMAYSHGVQWCRHGIRTASTLRPHGALHAPTLRLHWLQTRSRLQSTLRRAARRARCSASAHEFGASVGAV